MLPSKRRIRKTAFTKLLTGGSYGASPLLTIRFSRSQGETGQTKSESKSTFAIVVSKKVASSAVARNKIKRKCYHALRDMVPKIKDSYKIVFFAKKGLEKLSFKELEENIYSLLFKNRLIID